MPCWALWRSDRFPLLRVEACAARLKRQTHQAYTSTPQAFETVPQASAISSKQPSDEACVWAPQALAESLKEPSDEARSAMLNRAACDDHALRLSAQLIGSAGARNGVWM